MRFLGKWVSFDIGFLKKIVYRAKGDWKLKRSWTIHTSLDQNLMNVPTTYSLEKMSDVLNADDYKISQGKKHFAP